MLVEKLFLFRFLDKSKVIGHLYVIFFLPLTWVAFAITDVQQLGVYITRLFPFFGAGAAGGAAIGLRAEMAVLLAAVCGGRVVFHAASGPAV